MWIKRLFLRSIAVAVFLIASFAILGAILAAIKGTNDSLRMFWQLISHPILALNNPSVIFTTLGTLLVQIGLLWFLLYFGRQVWKASNQEVKKDSDLNSES